MKTVQNYLPRLDKNIFVDLFSVQSITSLSSLEQMCLKRPDDGGSTSRNVGSLRLLLRNDSFSKHDNVDIYFSITI